MLIHILLMVDSKQTQEQKEGGQKEGGQKEGGQKEGGQKETGHQMLPKKVKKFNIRENKQGEDAVKFCQNKINTTHKT